MKRCLAVLLAGLVVALGMLAIPSATADGETAVPVALVKMPCRGERNLPDLSESPDYLEQGGIAERLQQMSCRLKPLAEVRLTAEEQKQYGEGHRLGLANGHLGRVVAGRDLGRAVPEPTSPRGGPGSALPMRYIVLAGVRDTDPLEQELIDRSELEQLSVADIRARAGALQRQMQRLSQLVDVIYVHVDMDVLDPREVSGHPLAVKDCPTSVELAAALEEMFRYPKAAAFGVASTPVGARDPHGLSRQAAYNLIEGAIKRRQSGAQ